MWGLVLLGIYILALYLFFKYLFIPLMLLLGLAAVFISAFKAAEALGDVFRVNWSSRWLRSVLLLLLIVGLAVELGLLFAVEMDLIYQVDRESEWVERTMDWLTYVRYSPDHYAAIQLVRYLEGQELQLVRPAMETSSGAYWLYLPVMLFLKSLLVMLVISIGNTLWSRRSAPAGAGQPAYKTYFFRDVFLDIGLLAREALEGGGQMFRGFISQPIANMAPAWLLTWPVILLLAILAVVPFLFYGAMTVVMVVMMALGFIVVSVPVLVLALLMHLFERLLMLLRRIRMVCPACYKHISLPDYNCPKCGVRHDNLIPGIYGLFGRRCRCGKLLPTTFFNGRHKLDATCPHCEAALGHAVGVSQNIHLPVIGGPSAGKSSFLVASVVALTKLLRDKGGSLTIEATRSSRQLERVISDYRRGIAMNKTRAVPPEAALLRAHRPFDPDLTDGLLYMYDPGGEVFEDSTDLRRHGYFKDTDGILFLVDPFSSTMVRERYGASHPGDVRDAAASDSDPGELLARVISVYTSLSGSGRRKVGRIPFAVVLTKWDAADFSRRIPLDSEHSSSLLRTWLVNDAGFGNFVRSVENYFKDVGYFACSALGTSASSGKAFHPRGVLEPILWVTRKNRIV